MEANLITYSLAINLVHSFLLFIECVMLTNLKCGQSIGWIEHVIVYLLLFLLHNFNYIKHYMILFVDWWKKKFIHKTWSYPLKVQKNEVYKYSCLPFTTLLAFLFASFFKVGFQVWISKFYIDYCFKLG
jgi:hypothetical protein